MKHTNPRAAIDMLVLQHTQAATLNLHGRQLGRKGVIGGGRVNVRVKSDAYHLLQCRTKRE